MTRKEMWPYPKGQGSCQGCQYTGLQQDLEPNYKAEENVCTDCIKIIRFLVSYSAISWS